MKSSAISKLSVNRIPCLGRSSFQASVLLLVWLASTAISPAADKPSTSKYHFFPPAPDAPRLQFLVAYSSEKDLGGKGGGLMTFITGTPPPNKLLGKPYGAAIKDKKIYVCDTGYGEVLKLDLEAKRMSSVDSRGPGAFKLPVNIAVDSDGLLYVTDSGRNEVVILDRNENFVGTIGQTNVIKPRDVAPTADRLYVGDIETHSIHVFDRATRKPLFDIPRPEDATNIAHKLFQPANVAVDGKGRIYASDVGANRVQVYDADGKYLRTVGQYGDNSGEFSRPKGIALDRENRLYAVDAATQVVQLFDDAGRVLMWFGDPRSSNVGLQLPAKVALDYDNVGLFQRYAAPDFQVEYLVLVTSQFGPRKVSVFGFGHKK